eukprot:gene9945-13378_t
MINLCRPNNGKIICRTFFNVSSIVSGSIKVNIERKRSILLTFRYFSNNDSKGRSGFISRWIYFAHFHLNSLISNKEIYTIPNIITISRIAASPLLAYAISIDMKEVALGGCVVLAFSDWLDGYLAKVLNQRTILGSFLDPVADKFMIGSLCIGLLYQNLLPLPLVGIIVGRDVLLVCASFYMRGQERPQDAAFFETKDSSTFDITPSYFSKANTGLQFLLLTSTLSSFSFGFPAVIYIEPLWWITGCTTIGSGIGYLDGSGIRKAVKK